MKQIIEEPKWKGYTFEQMRMRHVVIKAQAEIEKYRLQNAADTLRQSSPLLNGSFLDRAAAAASYMEYGITAFRIVRRFIALFRSAKDRN